MVAAAEVKPFAGEAARATEETGSVAAQVLGGASEMSRQSEQVPVEVARPSG